MNLSNILDTVTAKARGILLWIIAPILGGIWFIAHYLSKKQQEHEELQRAKLDVKIKDQEEAINVQDKTVSDSMARYEQLRDAYKKGNGGNA